MIIVTGEKGELSLAIRKYLEESTLQEVKCLSVRGNSWYDHDFSNVDIVVHVAGIVPKVGIRPSDFYVVNRDLTERLAKKTKASGVKQFIYISSMAVYGIEASLNPQQGTVDENSVCKPMSDYGKSKLEAEKILGSLADSKLKVAIIRVPSVYGAAKREYFSQYELICNKFRCIPLAFRNCFRSAITIGNLCELIRLIIINQSDGIICPDNGQLSASDYCEMLHPEMRKSRLIGFSIEKFLRWYPMVKSLFGAVAYSPQCTNIFDGKYRISQ